MKNCLILGSGRSGSSMLAGCFRNTGCYMGEGMKGPTESNPMGYFESSEINDINEDLIRGLPLDWKTRYFPRWFPPLPLRKDQHWLALVPVGKLVLCQDAIAERVRRAVSHQPFCFKDPRFSYTLPAWRPFLDNPLYVCIFREPGRTANSILADCRSQPYLRDLPITPAWALSAWTLMYRHILERHRHDGEWLFVHYDQVLDGAALPELERRLACSVDRSFPAPLMKRSPDRSDVPRQANTVYRKLCALAGWRA